MLRKSSSPALTDALPQAEIRRRLLAVTEEARHVAVSLPLDHPWNAILRLTDIARYSGVSRSRIAQFIDGRITDTWQANLSRFFTAWDAGILVKALYEGRWQIVNRHTLGATLAQMAPAARPPLTMKIIDTPNGPRLRSV